MARLIKTDVLDEAAQSYARMWLMPDRRSNSDNAVFVDGPARVMQDLYNAAYMDEFEVLRDLVPQYLGAKAKDAFEAAAAKKFTSRDPKVFESELAARLAITPAGDHVEGKIGNVEVGRRLLGQRLAVVEAPWSLRRRKVLGLPKSERETITKLVAWWWPVYAGEEEERARPGGGAADPLPEDRIGPPAGAASMGISNEIALLMCDACVDNLDEGTGAAVIRLYGGTRATDVDTAVGAQTLLGTLVCTDPAFGAAADAAPGAIATASAITDDTSADATATATWFRASATNDGATPLDDHIDGNIGTSGEDLNLNTVSIVTGANLSISSWTVTMPES